MTDPVQFIRAARDFSNAGPEKFKPGYDQYIDLLEAAEQLALLSIPRPADGESDECVSDPDAVGDFGQRWDAVHSAILWGLDEPLLQRLNSRHVLNTALSHPRPTAPEDARRAVMREALERIASFVPKSGAKRGSDAEAMDNAWNRAGEYAASLARAALSSQPQAEDR